MFRKSLCMLLALVTLIGLLPIPSFAEEETNPEEVIAQTVEMEAVEAPEVILEAEATEETEAPVITQVPEVTEAPEVTEETTLPQETEAPKQEESETEPAKEAQPTETPQTEPVEEPKEEETVLELKVDSTSTESALVIYDSEGYESESNNSRSKADASSPYIRYHGDVERVNDPSDYFKFSVSNYCYFVMAGYSANQGTNKTKFRLYDSDGDLVKTSSYLGQDSDFGYYDHYYMEYSLRPGTYYLRVSDSTNISNTRLTVEYMFCYNFEAQLARPSVTTKNDAETGKPVLSWAAVSGNVSGYKVTRATSKSGTYYTQATVTDTTYTDTTAKAGKTYYYKVKAISGDNGVHDSLSSSYKSRTCDLPQPDLDATRSETTGKVKLTWNKISGADKYEVYYSTTETGSYKKLYTTSKTYYTHSAATVGVRYYYKVRAIDSDKSAANSAYSPWLSWVRVCAMPEITLSNVSSTGKIKVSWEKVTGATNYEVYRYNDTTGQYDLIGLSSGTSYTDNESLVPGTKYYYSVIATTSKNSGAYSSPSDVKSRTCDLPRPDISVSLSSKKPKISWDPIDGAICYKVYYSTDGSNWTLAFTTSDGDVSSVTHKKAKSGKKYYYRVKAIAENSAANSAYSSKKSITSK